MQRNPETYLSQLKNNRVVRSAVRHVLPILSLVVILGVFWNLKLTGITLAGEAFCGKAEHIHDEACTVRELICTPEESKEHIHTDDCVTKALTCGLEEQEVHTHADRCITRELICALAEEAEGHTHESGCYEEAACGLEEGIPHVHAEGCFTTTQACEASAESAGHTHTDACYEIQSPCPLEEHIHTESCYSDIAADVENSAVWEQTLNGLEAADTTAARITAAARSQLGYTESTLNFQVDELGIRRGYTRYGEWYGHPYGDWPAMFVAFCLHYAGVTDDMAPYNTGVEAMRLGWEESGICLGPDYMPEPGDILFLDKDANGSAEAAAIITGCTDGTLNVIEGDLENAVSETTYQTADSAIMGYGSIRSILCRSLTEADIAGIENVNARIAALPTEEEVLAQMDSMDQESEEFRDWYYALSQEVRSTHADYEALSADLRLFVADTTKMDALAWTWETAVLSNDIIASVSVYQINTETSATKELTTIAYGGSVGDKLGAFRDYQYWHAIVVDKNDDGFYVSSVNRDITIAKNDVAPSTAEGFVLLVYSNIRDQLANVAVGQSVQITPRDFYKNGPGASTTPAGTITFTAPKNNNLVPIETVSTKDWITINLFNYGSNMNDQWNGNKKYPGFQLPKDEDLANARLLDFGNSITVEKGVPGVQGAAEEKGAINGWYIKNGEATIDRPISGAINSKLIGGYPALTDGTSLAYLFTHNTYATKANSQNIDGLFQRNAQTGKYSFDSRSNAAVFDDESNQFKLYPQIITPNFIKYPFGNFLPFNDIQTQTTQTTQIDRDWIAEVAASALQKHYNGKGSEYQTLYNVLTSFNATMDNGWNYYDAITKYYTSGAPQRDDALFSNIYNIDYDEPTDFYFGMDMHMEFIQPKNGLTGPDGKQEMKYIFAGDDDVWVYIDDVLFLDLSGIHRPVGGQIDFTNGTVEYYEVSLTTGIMDAEPYKTVTFEEILGSEAGLNEKGTFEDYTSHTFDFFYMERGAGSSVCKMEFNLPVIQQNGITVTKELEGFDGTEGLGNPDFRFQVYKEDGKDLLIGANVEYSILDQSGNSIGTGKTDENGVFTIKAGQSAHFGNIPENAGKYFVRELLDSEIFSQYDQVTVDGTASTRDHYENVVVDNDSFKGVDSSVKDMSNGSTSFLFRNKVDPKEFAKLEISKELLHYNVGDENREFTILLSIDGVAVPDGTSYTLIAADGTETPETISAAGQLTLKHGQTARFDRVLAGSEIHVTEAGTSAAGYVVTYTGKNITLTSKDGVATGMIPANKTAHVKVTNTPDGKQLPIPGTKTLRYPDGETHIYTFELRQIESRTDATPVEDGTHQRQTVTLTEGSADFTFQLVYPAGTTPGTYYYLITEEGADAASGMDTSRYIAEVELTEADGVLTPELTALYKDGSTAESVAFTNEIVRSLTVEKTVENPISSDASFRFEITASVGGMPLEGTYSSIPFTQGKAVVELKHGESVTISGLPYGTAWTVTEVNAYGYFTKCGTTDVPMMSGSSISGSLTADETVSFLNFGGAELPATGSYARMAYTLGGWGIMLASLVYGFGSRRKRERRFH